MLVCVQDTTLICMVVEDRPIAMIQASSVLLTDCRLWIAVTRPTRVSAEVIIFLYP